MHSNCGVVEDGSGSHGWRAKQTNGCWTRECLFYVLYQFTISVRMTNTVSCRPPIYIPSILINHNSIVQYILAQLLDSSDFTT